MPYQQEKREKEEEEEEGKKTKEKEKKKKEENRVNLSVRVCEGRFGIRPIKPRGVAERTESELCSHIFACPFLERERVQKCALTNARLR